MAKKAGAKKGKLPKQVMGVKIPKDLRKAGDQLLEKANSPAGREVIAGALTMAAAAATAAVARGREKKAAAAPEAGVGGTRASMGASADATPHGTQRAPDPQAFADAFGQAAEMALGRLFGKRG